MGIFGDIFSDKDKYFIDTEIHLIDKSVEIIYKNFKSAVLKNTHTTKFKDDSWGRTETITKLFGFKKKWFQLSFKKYYSKDKKNWVLVHRKRTWFGINIADGPFEIRIKTNDDTFKKENEILSGINISVNSSEFPQFQETIQTKYFNNRLTKEVEKRFINILFPKIIKLIKKKIK